ncbi:MAG TPA: TIGR03545 family protein [Nitrospiria bacterium]
MTRWIRWPGLIAFLVITGGTAVFFILFSGPLIRCAIERSGTELVGAKVELDGARLTLSPLGVTLTGLAVTDAGEPMQNAFEASRIAFSLDGLNLLRRKVIIDEMAVEQMRFYTPRKTSGAIAKTPKSEKKDMPVPPDTAGITMPSLDLPDPKELLQKEELKSLSLVKSLGDQIDAKELEWNARLKSLPDKARLEKHRERIRQLQSSRQDGLKGILGSAKDAADLRKEIKTDLDRLQSAQKGLKTDLDSLRKKLDEAARAPQEDVRRLKEKYALSSQGLANISRVLFGGTVGNFLSEALKWRARLAPAGGSKKDEAAKKPPRGKGEDIRFPEKQPMPDFLIRIAHISAVIPVGELTGEALHITAQQDVLGKPATFRFSGEKMKGLETLRLAGEINHVNPSRPSDRAELIVRGYPLHEIPLSKGKDMPVVLKEGRTDFEVRGSVSGESLDATISAEVRSAVFSSGPMEHAEPVAKAIASALTEVKGFNVRAHVTGTIENHDTQMDSNLDNILRDAVRKQISEQAARFEARLKSAIAEKTDQGLADLKARLGGLSGLNTELTDRLKIGDGLAKDSSGGGKGGLKLPF